MLTIVNTYRWSWTIVSCFTVLLQSAAHSLYDTHICYLSSCLLILLLTTVGSREQLILCLLWDLFLSAGAICLVHCRWPSKMRQSAAMKALSYDIRLLKLSFDFSFTSPTSIWLLVGGLLVAWSGCCCLRELITTSWKQTCSLDSCCYFSWCSYLDCQSNHNNHYCLVTYGEPRCQCVLT